MPQGDAFFAAHADAGLAEMVKRLHGWAPQTILLEAAGGYEYGVVAALVAAGLTPVLINPCRVRQSSAADPASLRRQLTDLERDLDDFFRPHRLWLEQETLVNNQTPRRLITPLTA